MASRFSRMKRSRCSNSSLHHEAHQRADHRPALARALEEHPVVQRRRRQHQHQRQTRSQRQHQPGAAQVDGAALGQPGIRDNEMHFVPLLVSAPPMNRRHHPVTLHAGRRRLADAGAAGATGARIRRAAQGDRVVLSLLPCVPPSGRAPSRGPPGACWWKAAPRPRSCGSCCLRCRLSCCSRGWEVTAIRLRVQTASRRAAGRACRRAERCRSRGLVPIVGIELTTYRLQGGCSTN